jgi:hypothetical protein
VLVEVASAILVVGGLISILNSLDVVLRLAEAGPGVEPLALLTLGIGIASVVLGILTRYGRAWLVTLNAVAIAAFLELTSGTIVGLLFGGLDAFVVVVLLLHRPWFAWQPDADPFGEGDRR